MVRIALIRDDGTWEEKKLRIINDSFSDDVIMLNVIKYLSKIKYLSEEGKLPKGIIDLKVLPRYWDRKKKSLKSSK